MGLVGREEGRVSHPEASQPAMEEAEKQYGQYIEVNEPWAAHG